MQKTKIEDAARYIDKCEKPLFLIPTEKFFNIYLKEKRKKAL
jgi:hypothetical protein